MRRTSVVLAVLCLVVLGGVTIAADNILRLEDRKLLTGSWTCADNATSCTATGGATTTELVTGDHVVLETSGNWYEYVVTIDPNDPNTFTRTDYRVPTDDALPAVSASAMYYVTNGVHSLLEIPLEDEYGRNTALSISSADVDVNGTLGVTGAVTVAGAMTFSNDVSVSAHTSGNAGAVNEITGVPRLRLVALGTMTDGSTETVSLMDDTPAADWSAVGGTADPTDTEDTTYYKVGAKSLKLAWVDAAVDGDGVTDTIVSDDWEANESIGFWLYADATIASGDFEFVLTDDGGARTYNFPAYSTANVWQWCELDISGLAAGTGDAITGISILISAAGATNQGAINMYIDGVWCWDADEEEALGQAILPGGVLGLMTVATAAGSANTPALEVENTDYFIHYESGNDFIVTAADHSGNSGWVIVAIE